MRRNQVFVPYKCKCQMRQFVFKPKALCLSCKNPYVGDTPQGRNAGIGRFAIDVAHSVVEEAIADMAIPGKNLWLKKDVRCDELSLTGGSKADIAILNKEIDEDVQPHHIECIFEVKISLVWNWELVGDEVRLAGDCDQHTGNPSLLRSDNILKAIGKAGLFRGSSPLSARIPFIVLGNTGVSNTYMNKIDYLVRSGLIQRFINLTPELAVADTGYRETLSRMQSPQGGYVTARTISEFRKMLESVLTADARYFSSMMHLGELGIIIRSIDLAQEPRAIGEQFLERILATNRDMP